jgi:type IV pilus assembly protein PilC
MAKRFRYKLGDKAGPEAKGMIEAETERDAIKRLTQGGHTVLSIWEVKGKGMPFWERPHLSFEDKMLFTKHLATMLRAGITIVEALQILGSQTRQANNRQMYENILRSVKAGQSLSESMRVYDFIFSDLFINMIETGEKSGTLDQILDYLDEQLDKEYDLRKKVISAFIYPAVILSITMLLSLGIVFFIMPRITKIFSSFDIVLPLPTRILIGFSSLLTEKPLLTFGGTVLLVGLIVFLLKWKVLKPTWDWIALHLPVFGRVLHYANLARFSRTLTSLLQAGMPITKALNVISTMMTNTLYKEAIRSSAAKVEQGGQLGEAFEGQENLFPILAVKMLYVGERTGSLEATMKQLALLYERNVDSITRNLTVLLEPLLLVFMGMMVGGVAISIILPIYQLPNLISR